MLALFFTKRLAVNTQLTLIKELPMIRKMGGLLRKNKYKNASLGDVLEGILQGDEKAFSAITETAPTREKLAQYLSGCANPKLSVITFEISKRLEGKYAEFAADLVLLCLLAARERDKEYCHELSDLIGTMLHRHLEGLLVRTIGEEDKRDMDLAAFLDPDVLRPILDVISFHRGCEHLKTNLLCKIGDRDTIIGLGNDIMIGQSPHVYPLASLEALSYVEDEDEVDKIANLMRILINRSHERTGAFDLARDATASEPVWKAASELLLKIVRQRPELTSIMEDILNNDKKQPNSYPNGYDTFVGVLANSEFKGMITSRLNSES